MTSPEEQRWHDQLLVLEQGETLREASGDVFCPTERSERHTALLPPIIYLVIGTLIVVTATALLWGA